MPQPSADHQKACVSITQAIPPCLLPGGVRKVLRRTAARRSLSSALTAVAVGLTLLPITAWAKEVQDTEIVNQTPIPIEIQSSGVSHLIGVTEAQKGGGHGVMYLNDLCDAEFPGTHWCTTEEIARSNANTVPTCVDDSDTDGWVRPLPEAAGIAVLVGQPGVLPEASLGPVIVDRTTGMSNMEVRNHDGGAVIYRGLLSCSEENLPLSVAGAPRKGMIMNCDGQPAFVRCDLSHRTMCCGMD